MSSDITSSEWPSTIDVARLALFLIAHFARPVELSVATPIWAPAKVSTKMSYIVVLIVIGSHNALF